MGRNSDEDTHSVVRIQIEWQVCSNKQKKVEKGTYSHVMKKSSVLGVEDAASKVVVYTRSHIELLMVIVGVGEVVDSPGGIVADILRYREGNTLDLKDGKSTIRSAAFHYVLRCASDALL